jgi:putative ABC transport system ATP-binding protein
MTTAPLPDPDLLADPEPPVVLARDLVMTYGEGDATVHALRGVSLSVDRGDYVAIMGSSGSGKSTLLNIIGCLDAPTSGTYELDGVDVGNLSDNDLTDLRNEKLGFVFQGFNLLRRTSALRQVELPLAYAGVPRRERRPRALAMLEAVGLGERIDHLPTQLSGGQQQRVAVARALVTEPALLLADEPTGNLDSRSTDDLLGLFAQLNDEGRTIIVITHEDAVAKEAKRVLVLTDGEIVQDRRQAPVDGPPPRLGAVA